MRRIVLSCAILLCLGGFVRAEEFKDFSAAYAAGSAAFSKGDYAAAIEPLKAAMKLASIDELRAEPRKKLITIYQKTNNVDGLIALFDEEVVAGDTRAKRLETAQSFVSDQKKSGLFEKVHGVYLARLKTKPDDYPALAVVLAALEPGPASADREKHHRTFEQLEIKRCTEQAEKLDAEGADGDDGAPLWYAMAAQAWGEAGNGAKMEASAKKSLAIRSSQKRKDAFLDQTIRRHIGYGYLGLGRIDEAIASFEAAIKADPDDLGADLLRRKIDELRRKKGVPQSK